MNKSRDRGTVGDGDEVEVGDMEEYSAWVGGRKELRGSVI